MNSCTFGDARLPQRFWSKISQDEHGCWIWTANKNKGYGRFRISNPRSVVQAHRYSYEQLVGPIPDGLDLDHMCRVPACCNPAHLEAVTRRTNLLRGETLPASQTTRTHCPKGHPYSGENLAIKNGTRQCRECTRERDRNRPRRYAAHPLAKPTHCPKGHEYTESNSLRSPGEGLRCRICRAEKNRAYNARRKALTYQQA